MIARAGDAVPKSYRQNPGAVLLALEWAAARDVDALSAIQTVSFVSGRPVIDSTMQRALAKRAGYRVVVKAASTDAATVEVHEGGELLGSVTYTLDEAKAAGLLGKDNWRHHPKAMLVARATTQAMRWFAPEVMVGIEVADPDPIATLESEPVETSEPRSAPAEAETVEAEVAETDAEGDAEPITARTLGEVKAAIESAKASGAWPEAVNRMRAEGIPVRPQSMTEPQGRRTILLCGNPKAAA